MLNKLCILAFILLIALSIYVFKKYQLIEGVTEDVSGLQFSEDAESLITDYSQSDPLATVDVSGLMSSADAKLEDIALGASDKNKILITNIQDKTTSNAEATADLREQLANLAGQVKVLSRYK